MNDTMRSIPPIFARSRRNSFATTTAIRPAPATQSTRSPRRCATSIATSASTAQKIDSDA